MVCAGEQILSPQLTPGCSTAGPYLGPYPWTSHQTPAVCWSLSPSLWCTASGCVIVVTTTAFTISPISQFLTWLRLRAVGQLQFCLPAFRADTLNLDTCSGHRQGQDVGCQDPELGLLMAVQACEALMLFKVYPCGMTPLEPSTGARQKASAIPVSPDTAVAPAWHLIPSSFSLTSPPRQSLPSWQQACLWPFISQV